MRVLFVLGGPCSGKGTQCSRLITALPNSVHLSAGELLRRANVMQDYLASGRIVPAEVTVGLLSTAIEARPDTELFLVDGFPRNMENYNTWYRILPHIPVVGMLVFEVSPAEMLRRMLGRGQDRSDDTEETLRRRQLSFQHETGPVIEVFQTHSRLFKVSGEGSEDDVFASVMRDLAPWL